jgi:secreted PhoX family phosphatase
MTLTREQAIEFADDTPSNPTRNETFEAINARRLSRRGVLKGAMMAGTALAVGGAGGLLSRPADAAPTGSFRFEEISHGVDETHHVAPGYDADILIRWGDPVFADAPAFDPMNQTPESQARQFGYNNDYIGLHPLSDRRAVLCVNHEYTNEEVMFPGIGRQDKDGFPDMTDTLVRTEMAAHGGTVIEIERGADGKWRADPSGALNRRITAFTPMRISGPAAGHDRMKTSDDPSGTAVLGTINNCAGGMTPWGTYLMAEENFHGYFWGKDGLDAHPGSRGAAPLRRAGRMVRLGQVRGPLRRDEGAERGQPLRLGRRGRHHGPDLDAREAHRTRPLQARGRREHRQRRRPRRDLHGRRSALRLSLQVRQRRDLRSDGPGGQHDLLDDGTLYVARFDDDGSLTWMPLVHGEGPLTAEPTASTPRPMS